MSSLLVTFLAIVGAIVVGQIVYQWYRKWQLQNQATGMQVQAYIPAPYAPTLPPQPPMTPQQAAEANATASMPTGYPCIAPPMPGVTALPTDPSQPSIRDMYPGSFMHYGSYNTSCLPVPQQ